MDNKIHFASIFKSSTWEFQGVELYLRFAFVYFRRKGAGVACTSDIYRVYIYVYEYLDDGAE